MQSNPSCPNCTRNFRGLQSQGPQDRGGLLPLLLRCGHTFCCSCLSKLVKLQKSNITCPQCQVSTPMPFGEASLKSLPPDYYRLGQVMSNYKQLNDLIQQKMDMAAKPAAERKVFEGKLLKACPGRELCEECRRALSTCSCRQCNNTVMCDNCFTTVHRGNRTMQNHTKRPFTKDRSIAKCADHGEEEKYFCTQDDIPVCGHCAIIGSHKGHTIVPIAEETKEAFNELPSALDKGVASLKKLYYGKQAILKAKNDARKEAGTVLESVSSAFATQISLLQMRAHHILEIIHNNCTDELDWLSELEANISSNIAILEGTIEDASYAIKTENDTDSNLLRMVETLSSTDLPCHFVMPEGLPPMAAFTYDKDFGAKILNFGSVGVDSGARGDLKCEDDLPEDYEHVDIKDDILQQSSAFKIDQKGQLKIKDKVDKATEKKKSDSSRAKGAGHRTDVNRNIERVNNMPLHRTPFQPETRALVRLVHIRNPCYFFVQREADQMELGNMMARINGECNRMREQDRVLDKIEPGVLCCAKYLDGRWYRARIKSILEPLSKQSHSKGTKKKSRKKKSSRSSDAESTKDENEEKPTEVEEGAGDKKEGEDSEKGDAEKEDAGEGKDEGNDKEGDGEVSSDKKDAADKDDDEEDVEIDVEVSSQHSAKSTHSVKSSQSAKSTQSETSEGRSSSGEAARELMVEVVYVDFGNNEIVPVSKLCKLKPRMQRFPEMAVCCSLVDIVPNNYEGKWTAEVNQGFARMVGDQIVSMSVQASAGALLYVDLHKLPNEEVENDMPVSLRDALVFLELACFKSPESMPKESWQQTRSYLGADLPKAGSSVNATVSHINNPGSFYVQELGEDLEYLLTMMKNLQEVYSKREHGKWGILCPQIGMICVAKFELDNQWYRAQIIGLPGKQLVELVYVDYGNLDTVHCSDLRKVTNEFLKLPVQALPCSLADIEPLEDPSDGWPQYVAGEFFGLVAQKTLKVIVKSVEDGCLSVVLLYEDEEKEKCANAELVRNGHAKSTGPSSTVLSFGTQADTPKAAEMKEDKKEVTDGASSVGAVQDKGPVTKPASKATSKTKEYTVSASAAKSESSKNKTAIYTKVHVSHIESPACIYVQLATAGKDGLDSLLEAMTLHYKDSEPEDSVWQEGDICCALLVRENVWCRAKIKTVLPEDSAVVLFSDYGNTEMIKLGNVRPLEDKFQQAPPFAIQCHLAEVIPAGDKQKWTKTACEFLVSKLADLECCIVKKGELVAGSLPIDLLYEMSVEEKLERETTEDLFSISKLLKQKGLAFAPRDPAMHPLPLSGDSDSDFLSDSGPSGEGGKKSSRVKKRTSPSKLDEEEPSETVSVVEESQDQGDQPITTDTPPEIIDQPPGQTTLPPRRLSPPVVVLDSSSSKDAIEYKPRSPPKADVVQLVITYVDMDGVIFGVEVEEVSKLQQLVAKLQAEMATRPPSTDVSFYKGQAVCAQFTQDGLWYRAKVLGGTQQGVKVHYIDFGNTEITAPDKIQPIAFDPDVPQKSQGCKLINLYPKEPHTQWPKEIIDTLLGTLLEQTCVVEIKSLCSEDKPWKVDLKLPDGKSLRQVLLDMEYAKEGSPSSSSEEDLEEEETESGEEAADVSSGVSSSAVSSADAPPQTNTQDNDNVGSVRDGEAFQKVTKDDDSDEEEEREENRSEEVDVMNYCMSGTGIAYTPMRLPEEGVFFGAQVTQVDLPDLLYIQIVPSPDGNTDPTVHRSAEELYMLGELIKELNKLAPQLPRLPTANIKPGQVCCALYELDLQYYRGKVVAVRDRGEKLVQVQYVDYGNSEWHSPDSLRQIPDKFITLPTQARKCKITGIKPPQNIPEGDTLLLDSKWPMTSGRRMVELVNNKQLVASVKRDAVIPEILLFESSSESPIPDPKPIDGFPLHLKLIEEELAEMDNLCETEDPVAEGQESEV